MSRSNLQKTYFEKKTLEKKSKIKSLKKLYSRYTRDKIKVNTRRIQIRTSQTGF